MDSIKSQDIKDKLTHVTPNIQNYFGIKKYGVNVCDRIEYMLWKPNAFWISMNNDWERWCHSEDFGSLDKSIVCDVILKKDLKLLKVTTVKDAVSLAKILMPDFHSFPFYGRESNPADMISMSMYMTQKIKEGVIIGPEFWNPITENYDGVYYVNSWPLHGETFFNAWDADCIALFDGKNATLENPRSGKEIIDKLESEL